MPVLSSTLSRSSPNRSRHLRLMARVFDTLVVTLIFAVFS